MIVPSRFKSRLIVVLMCVAGQAQAAPEAYSSVFADGLAARRSGDFVAAEKAFLAAVAATPQSAEAWNNLALVQGYQSHYADAIASIDRAVALAPNDLDITLTRARILAWVTRYAEAERETDRVLNARPKDDEALALRGRIAYYQNQQSAAQTHFNAALAVNPRNLDAVLGLGDVERARGDETAAAVFYRRGNEIDPGSKDVADRLLSRAVDGPLWRFDIGGSHSWLKRTALADWSSQTATLQRKLGATSFLSGGIGRYQRFGARDLELTASFGAPLVRGLRGQIDVGGTPSADFLPRWTLRPSLSATVTEGTSVVFQGSIRDYAAGTVSGVNIGIEQYLLEGRVLLTGNFINTFDPAGKHVAGWNAGVSAAVVDRLTLRISYADAAESDAGVVVGTRTWATGLSYDISQTVTLRADFAREKRATGTLRDELTIGMALRY